jgi:hypothetical protein
MRSARSSAARLTTDAAETWCLDNIAVSIVGLIPDRLVWVRLDVRADLRERAAIEDEDEGISLSSLIEIFSRPGKQQPNQWRLEAGPIRLRDIQKSAGRTGT